MAEWVSHLIVADRVLERLPWLKKHEFCVGNIAPDCNIPNEDWSEFTPSRAITHWMKDNRKRADDCISFRDAYILDRAAKSGPGKNCPSSWGITRIWSRMPNTSGPSGTKNA